MTSWPASRSARATILAPRSCPSRPGLATTMRSREDGGRHGRRLTDRVRELRPAAGVPTPATRTARTPVCPPVRRGISPPVTFPLLSCSPAPIPRPFLEPRPWVTTAPVRPARRPPRYRRHPLRPGSGVARHAAEQRTSQPYVGRRVAPVAPTPVDESAAPSRCRTPVAGSPDVPRRPRSRPPDSPRPPRSSAARTPAAARRPPRRSRRTSDDVAAPDRPPTLDRCAGAVLDARRPSGRRVATRSEPIAAPIESRSRTPGGRDRSPEPARSIVGTGRPAPVVDAAGRSPSSRSSTQPVVRRSRSSRAGRRDRRRVEAAEPVDPVARRRSGAQRRQPATRPAAVRAGPSDPARSAAARPPGVPASRACRCWPASRSSRSPPAAPSRRCTPASPAPTPTATSPPPAPCRAAAPSAPPACSAAAARSVSRDSDRQARRCRQPPGGGRRRRPSSATRRSPAFAAQAEKQAAQIKLHQWVLPVTPGVYHLTARFGDYSSLWSHFHTGLDFAAPTGTPIMAVAGGTITEVGYAGAYGNRPSRRSPTAPSCGTATRTSSAPPSAPRSRPAR